MANATQALFHGRSDTILSHSEMIRNLPQQGCCKTGDVTGHRSGGESRVGRAGVKKTIHTIMSRRSIVLWL